MSRSVTANYIEDQQFNTVTRYVMLTFSYRFTRLGKGTSEKTSTTTVSPPADTVRPKCQPT